MASDFKIKSAVGTERLRCFKLVEAYREKIEHAMAARGSLSTPGQTRTADRVIEALRAIEHEIKHPRGNLSSGSDFSLDEIAIAEKLIAEQEHNPFEV
jgi:hypothetical protein